MEGGTAKTCRRDRSPNHSVPLSSRNQQVDQDRASPVLVHQSELARSTAAESRSYRQSDRQHENQAGTQGTSQVRHQPISLWSQGPMRNWRQSCSNRRSSTENGTTTSFPMHYNGI